MGFRRKQHTSHAGPFDLDHVLLHLSDEAGDTLRLEDLTRGTFICGSSGSGKTTGPLATIVRSFLDSGYGGLVLTTKPGERQQWERWCQQSGRSDDLIVMDDTGEFRFNFMEYESKRAGPGGGLTNNLAAMFLSVMEATESGRAHGQDQFWRLAVKQLIKNCIDLLQAAGEELSITNLKQLVVSAPSYPEQIQDAGWASKSYCCHCLEAAQHPSLDTDERIDLNDVERYWLIEVPGQDDRTRANVFQTFSVMADGFCRGLFRKLFSTDLNIKPELSLKGKIILIDLPVKTHEETGRSSQVLWKHIWQKAMERRDLKVNKRPVFLCVDEAQEFVTSTDAQFQATARSSRVCVINATQSIAGFYAQMGGAEGKYATDALLANLSLKVFCSSGCVETNRWAEELFNKKWRYRGQSSVSFSQQQASPNSLSSLLDGPPKPQISGSVSPSLESQVLATAFTKLKSGGKRNFFSVETLVFQTSRVWARTNANYLPVTFIQEF